MPASRPTTSSATSGPLDVPGEKLVTKTVHLSAGQRERVTLGLIKGPPGPEPDPDTPSESRCEIRTRVPLDLTVEKLRGFIAPSKFAFDSEKRKLSHVKFY